MYSPVIIERRRQAIHKRLGFLPERSAPDKIAYLKDTIERITRYDDNGQAIGFLEEPPPWLSQMIRNEIEMCRLDFLYWGRHYAKIRTSSAEIIPFIPTRAQQIALHIWAEMEEASQAIWIQQLKARQLGVSTLTELAIGHRVQFYPNIKAVIASSDPKKSEQMSEMMIRCWDNQPWWIKPRETSKRTGSYMAFTHGSQLYIEHGTRTSGIARGTTPSLVHLCFSPNTLIHCSDGTIKPITEVTPNQEVIAGNGTVTKVRALARSSRHNELTSLITLWGNPVPLETTRDHRIMTPYGYREAKDILRGEYVVHPVRPIINPNSGVEIIIKRYRSGMAGSRGEFTPIPINLNKDFGYLCGLYLAEGSLGYHKKARQSNVQTVFFSIHEREEEYLRERLIKAVNGAFNITRKQRKNSKSMTLAINCRGLGEWLEENFGSIDGKVIPSWVWDMGEDFCRGIVMGYIEGDGHIPLDSNEVMASSIRPSITFQLRDLIASLGYGWSGITYRQEGFWYGRQCKSIWTLQVAGDTGYQLRKDLGYPVVDATWEEGSGRHWAYSLNKKEVQIEVFSNLEGYCEDFYDLEVEHSDHNFCTVQCGVANSELPNFADPEELIDSSLIKALHPDPWQLVILESTAKGIGNWWHDTWLASLDWPDSDFRPMFLPWYVDELFWPTPTWIHDHPIPQDWKPLPNTISHAERASRNVAEDPILRQYFPKGWRMPPEKMWFYERDRETAIKKKQLAHWLGEMPADHEEAFQSTTYSAFDVDTIARHSENCIPPLAIYGFIGTEIPLRHQPSIYEMDFSYETDPTAPSPITIPIHWSDDPNYQFSIQLVPLRRDILSTTNPLSPFGKLLVYEFPDGHSDYGFGVDTSDGIGADRTVIEGFRKGVAGLARNFQICELASPYLNAHDLWPMLMAIATWYAPFRDGERVQPKLVIECNVGSGESVQWECIKRGWYNMHDWVRYDSKKINKAKAHKIGWYTTTWSRNMMLDLLLKSLRDDFLIINSRWFVSEMKALQRDEFEQKLQADHGQHDDRIMAMAMVQYSLWDMEIMTGTLNMTIRSRLDEQPYPTLRLPSSTPHLWKDPSDYLEREEGVTLYGEDPENEFV